MVKNFEILTQIVPHISIYSYWHYLAVKTLSELLRGITGNNHGDFYCLNYLHSYTTKNKLKKHQKICENNEYCKLEMPKKGSVLKYISGEKAIMTPLVIYADLESILDKISKNCMKNFCLDLREHAEIIINYEQAKMIAPTKKERKAHRDQKVCCICKRAFNSDDVKYYKIKDHCYYRGRYLRAAHVVCSKKCKIPKEIPVVFHNGWLKNLKANLIVWVKIQKNILHLVFLLKSRVMMVNQLCIK